MPKGMRGFQKGSLNPSLDPKRRRAISEWRRNQKISPKTRRRISQSMKRTLRNPEIKAKWVKNATGRKLTDETKLKMKATRRKNHPLSLKSLIRDLDIVFSRYKRLLNSNLDGYIECFTCGRFFKYSEIDCGHYINRNHKSLRWEERNTEPQCRSCNRFHEGVKDVFALKLIEKYGDGILQELNEKKAEIKKYTVPELLELTEHYKKEIAKLED